MTVRRTALRMVVVAGVMLVSAGCGDDGAAPVTLVEGVTDDGASVLDNTFRPGRVEVAAGTEVVWDERRSQRPQRAARRGRRLGGGGGRLRAGRRVPLPLHRARHLRLLLLAPRHHDQGHGRHDRGHRLTPTRKDSMHRTRRIIAATLVAARAPRRRLRRRRRQPPTSDEDGDDATSSDHPRARRPRHDPGRRRRRRARRPRPHRARHLRGGRRRRDRGPHHPRPRPQRGDPRRRLRARERHPGARRRRGRREHDGPATTRPTGSSGPASRLPRLVPHRRTATATTASTPSTPPRASSSTSTPRAAPTPACTSASATRATP